MLKERIKRLLNSFNPGENYNETQIMYWFCKEGLDNKQIGKRIAWNATYVYTQKRTINDKLRLAGITEHHPGEPIPDFFDEQFSREIRISICGMLTEMVEQEDGTLYFGPPWPSLEVASAQPQEPTKATEEELPHDRTAVTERPVEDGELSQIEPEEPSGPAEPEQPIEEHSQDELETDPIVTLFTRRTGDEGGGDDDGNGEAPTVLPHPNRRRNVGIAIALGIAGILALSIMCVAAYFLLTLIEGDDEPTPVLAAEFETAASEPTAIPTITPNFQETDIANRYETATVLAATIEKQDEDAQATVNAVFTEEAPTYTPTPPTIPLPLPYMASFDSGLDSNWIVVDGVPIVADGWLNGGYDGLTIRLNETLPDSFIIEFDHKDLTHINRVDMTFSDSFRIEMFTRWVGWEIRNNGRWTEVGRTDIAPYSDGHIRIEVVGDRFVVYGSGELIGEMIVEQPESKGLMIKLVRSSFIDNLSITR